MAYTRRITPAMASAALQDGRMQRLKNKNKELLDRVASLEQQLEHSRERYRKVFSRT